MEGWLRHDAAAIRWGNQLADPSTAITVRTSSPLKPYSDIPRTYVVLQRINPGLYAVLGVLNATQNWRRIAEEIWPFALAGPSTPMGEAEHRWERERHGAPGLSLSA